MNKKYLYGLISCLVVLATLGIAVAVSTVNPGDTINMHTSSHCNIDYVADLNFSDGRVLYMYGAWKLLSPSGEILIEEPLTQFVDGQTDLDIWIGITVEEIGTYQLVSGIFYVEQVYNENTEMWETITSGQCVYDTHHDIIIVTYPNPSPEEILAIITQLYENWQNNV